MTRFANAAALFVFLTAGPFQGRAEPPTAESFLHQGQLEEGEKALSAAIQADPKNDSARFGLGVIQFVSAVEARMQAFHRHGFGSSDIVRELPITNLPIAKNPNPDPLDYAKARALVQNWVDDLAKVDKTLAGITDPNVKLPIRLADVRLDFNGDGVSVESETLWNIYAQFNRPVASEVKAPAEVVFAFDRGDVDWLRGYCHLLSTFGEILLAHDFSAPFNESGYLLFTGIKPSSAFQSQAGASAMEFGTIADAVAMIHLIRLPVVEPNRMKSALGHLEQTVALSRSSWKAILAETDDDREWIPGPKQTTVVRNGAMTTARLEGWNLFLDEFESLLQGRKLIPFWRGADPTLGLNLRKVFTEPQPFDLVLWVQGSGVKPFLENGRVTSPETWRQLQRIFGGEFLGFALWLN